MTFRGNVVREEIGILVAISAGQFVFWVFKQQNVKFEIDSSMIKLEDDVNVGDWINVTFIMENGNADLHYVVRKTPAEFNMPTLIVDERTIITTINFIPLDEFLYPLTAVEKNLRMCFSLEIGRIPLVFTNTYLPHCCYEGVAQITLNKNDVELKIENYYNTPWLVKKNEKNYEFSGDQTLESKLHKGNGLIVRCANAKDFYVLSQKFGLLFLNRQASNKFNLGDFIGFFVAETIEDSSRRQFALAPRKLLFDLPVMKNSDGTIDITHEILVGGRPTTNGCYYVEGVGDIRDSHALISTNIGGETRRLRVVSRCVFEPIGAYFTICELLSIPKNNDRNSTLNDNTLVTNEIGGNNEKHAQPFLQSSSSHSITTSESPAEATTMGATSNTTVKTGAKTGSTSSTSQSEIGCGVVVSQVADSYYVYSSCYEREALLPKYLPEFKVEKRAMNVGQWIQFVAQVHSTDRVLIISFSYIDPLFLTMPSFNTIVLECKIIIPSDYSPNVYGYRVTSEFMPAVGDQDLLIRKCHHGKTLLATVRRTKTNIPDVFWNIEYIKL